MTRLALLAGVVALLAAAPGAQAAGSWLSGASDQLALASALTRYSSKLPREFNDRLQYALPDGTLRVMVAVNRRDAATMAAANAATTWVAWYGHSPRFMARITPDQLTKLLTASYTRFVEPDYPINLKLSVSVPDVHARATATNPGIWSFDQSAGLRGGLSSAMSQLTTDQVTGKGVTVAIVDGGIDGTHRDFGGWDCNPDPLAPCDSRIKELATIEPLLGAEFEPAGEPDNDFAGGHGTHVAGIVAGNGFAARDSPTVEADPATFGGDGFPIGVAPQASLVGVKIGDTLSAAFANQGLQWVLDNHERLGIRAVNNSWGCVGGCSYDPASVESGLQKDLYHAGVFVAQAAGNDGGDSSGASFSGDSQSPYVLSVANYDAHNHLLASDSSRGAASSTLPSAATFDPDSEASAGQRRPDIAAPGTDIWSTRNLTGGAASGAPRQSTSDVIGGDGCCIRQYALMGGTSMATPHVVGAAADLFSACPSATVRDVMRALLASADSTRVATTDGSRTAAYWEVGYGALDVRAALDWLANNVSVCRYILPNTAPVAAFSLPGNLTGATAGTFDASASSDREGPIASYGWDFGDGSTATGAVVSHTYARSGTYDVTLTVTDSEGAANTVQRTVTVANSVPSAAFSGPSTLVHEAGGAFDGGASRDADGALVSYAWDFGDGATATTATASHAFTWAGTYTVRLTVTDDEGATNTITRDVTVTDTPASGFVRLFATGVDNHKCDSSGWTFTLVNGNATPANIAVFWADGSRQRVPLSSGTSRLATYVTTAHLDKVATKAYLDVPSSATKAVLSLVKGPCH